MPRPVYYQSPGNPLQTDRLPAEPMGFEFAHNEPDHAMAREAVRNVIGRVCVASVIGQAVGCIDLFTGVWVFQYPLVFVIAALFARRLMSSDIIRTTVIAALSLLLLNWFDVRLPWHFELAVPLLATALLGREIARNYVFLATASPMDRDLAWRCRNLAGWQTLASCTLLCPIAIGICLPGLLVPCVMLTLFLTLGVVFVRGESLANIIRGFWSALRWWCAYNVNNDVAPGILQSPSGDHHARTQYLLHAASLAGFLAVRTTLSIPLIVMTSGSFKPVVDWFSSLSPQLLVLNFTLLVLLFVSAPIVLLLATIFVVGLPVFGHYRFAAQKKVAPTEWQALMNQISQSPNPHVQGSIYQGHVACNGSPVCIPRSVFHTPVHIAGDTGVGKTARGIIPLAEQLLSDCNSSLVMIDMKGDSHELLASLKKSADSISLQTGQPVPVRYFTTLRDDATFAFNPFLFECWPRLTVDQQADIICAALGLLYGTGYGEGHYSTANTAFVYAVLKHFPEVRSFADLADRMQFALKRPKSVGLDDAIQSDGSHVRRIVDQLANVSPLNVSAGNTPSDDVIAEIMDPAGLFQQPEIHYFHLSSTLGPGVAPHIARLAVYMLLTTAKLSSRDKQVYLIIDEFQRIATSNLDYLLQLSRSMGVGVTLANQSIADLRKSGLDIVIDSNCRYRRWFGVAAWDEQDRLMNGSGECVDQLRGWSTQTSTDSQGRQRESFSETGKEFIGPRLTKNDIKLVTDDDRKSIIQLTRGAGYSQYGGMPLVVESDFHITKEEYERRRDSPWPTGEHGTFVPDEWLPNVRTPLRQKPGLVRPTTITHETIDDSDTGSPGLFDRYLADHPFNDADKLEGKGDES
ncbi:MAG: hypothetical protein HQ518_25380 [Rhodopirellula sp.]|nr:hypothetical protein [Rhodopirellula sp.]